MTKNFLNQNQNIYYSNINNSNIILAQCLDLNIIHSNFIWLPKSQDVIFIIYFFIYLIFLLHKHLFSSFNSYFRHRQK